VAQAPRVLLIGKKIGYWISLREATLSPCGYSRVLKGPRLLGFESPTIWTQLLEAAGGRSEHGAIQGNRAL